MIKGAATKKGEYKVCSYTEDSVSGVTQIYLDALKDEASRDKLPGSRNLSRCCFILFAHFNDDVNDFPGNANINASVYHRMPKIPKDAMYHVMKESKNDMDEMMEQETIVPAGICPEQGNVLCPGYVSCKDPACR